MPPTSKNGLPAVTPEVRFSLLKRVTFGWSFSRKEEEKYGIIEGVLKTAAEEGYLNTEAIFVDGTHIKANAKCDKTVTRHIWQDFVELAEDIRHTPVYSDLYRQRKEKIERVFADAKEKNGMRRTQYRGIARVSNWVKLKFVAMNLKKLATWKWNATHPAPKRRKPAVSLSSSALSILFFFPSPQKPVLL